MLGKILLTIAVIVVALVYLLKRRTATQSPGRPASSAAGTASGTTTGTEQESRSFGADLRLGAWMFLILMLGAGATLYALRWQDENREVTVILHRDEASSPVIYRVSKKDLSERSFTTVDGVRVTVSANERMEVVGL